MPRPVGKAGFGLHKLAEVVAEEVREPRLLPLERLAAVRLFKAAAVDHEAVLVHQPRAAFTGLGIKDAGIKGESLVRRAEPLLQRHISVDGPVEKGLAHDGPRAVRADEAAAGERPRALRRPHGEDEAPVRSRHGRAAPPHDLDRRRHERNEPAVEGVAVHIEIIALVVAHAARAQVHCLHREDLRIGKHAFGQYKVEVRERLLRVGREQTAAGLLVSLVLRVEQQNFQLGTLLHEAAGKGRARGARADDGGIVLHGASSLVLFCPSA